jgi:hypothetical protein
MLTTCVIPPTLVDVIAQLSFKSLGTLVLALSLSIQLTVAVYVTVFWVGFTHVSTCGGSAFFIHRQILRKIKEIMFQRKLEA